MSDIPALVRKEIAKLSLDQEVEDYVTKISTCVLDEGGRSRQLKNIIGPIIEEFVNDEDLSEFDIMHTCL